MLGFSPRQCVLIQGTVYGVALNNREHVKAQSEAFRKLPYQTPPSAPVLFIKPRNTFLVHGGTIQLPPALPELEASAALALVFASDTRRVPAEQALNAVAGYTLAIDLSEPGADFFRPPVREKCRDGFLPIGPSIVARDSITDLEDVVVRLEIDGAEAATFRVGQSIRPIAKLIEHVSAFMTFRAGDALLAAATPPGPRAPVGSRISVVAHDIGCLECVLGKEEAVSQ